jgi:nitroreductase
MNLNTALGWRYATKVFDPSRFVDEAVVESILEAGNLAATSYGLQPFQLVVLQDRALREELVASSFSQRQVVDSSHLIVIAIRTNINEDYIRQFIQCKETQRQFPSGALAGYGDIMTGKIMGMSDSARLNWAARQAYLVMGTMLAACALAQVDACPMEGFVPDEVNQKLNLAKYGLHAQLLLPIGYRSAEDETQFMAKVRRPLDETVIRL